MGVCRGNTGPREQPVQRPWGAGWISGAECRGAEGLKPRGLRGCGQTWTFVQSDYGGHRRLFAGQWQALALTGTGCSGCSSESGLELGDWAETVTGVHAEGREVWMW